MTRSEVVRTITGPGYLLLTGSTINIGTARYHPGLQGLASWILATASKCCVS